MPYTRDAMPTTAVALSAVRSSASELNQDRIGAARAARAARWTRPSPSSWACAR